MGQDMSGSNSKRTKVARMEKTVKVRKKVTGVFLAGLGTNN